jgi:hypothetical protein
MFFFYSVVQNCEGNNVCRIKYANYTVMVDDILLCKRLLIYDVVVYISVPDITAAGERITLNRGSAYVFLM